MNILEVFEFFSYQKFLCFIFTRERNSALRSNRKLDKKVKELMLQAEEERRHADQYKEQVSIMVF